MAVQLKEITIAHSPDSDDAFMFYGLAAEKLNTAGLKINQVLKDIQTLNLKAIEGKYEVSAISFAAYPLVAQRYALMPCGSSMGFKYGPMLVSSKPLNIAELGSAKIAIPGKLTTAYLTLQLFQPGLNVVEMPFDYIAKAVVSHEVDAGLIIHEGQLTYNQMGLTKVLDLGEWWFQQTGLPLPLGGNVIRKDLGAELMHKLTKLLQESIAYALSHRQEALAYAMQFARDMNQDLADKFVSMYVNDLTVDYGSTGRQALVKLFQMAYGKGVLKEPVKIEFVDLVS
ncbi:MAG: ABC transporter substrate-binding protein [Candidatus Melainabacteria bacterium]|nr:ABC transporter substrate-binding protein [Candidatus Melainabacteria bacterium]